MGIKTKFSNTWSKVFKKKKAIFTANGRTAIYLALKQLESKKVVMPTYTCRRVLDATLDAKCEPIIVDCGYDLQISFLSVIKALEEGADTVIIPHMFGIQAPVNLIYKLKYTYDFKIIEDCSQCMGLPDIGKYSDVVMASLGPSKFIPVGDDKLFGGGVLAYNKPLKGKYHSVLGVEYMEKAIDMASEIEDRLKKRTVLAQELITAKMNLIGQDQPNAWLRAMYVNFDQKQSRVPYTPLHDIYGPFDCPKVDSYKDYIDWISIII